MARDDDTDEGLGTGERRDLRTYWGTGTSAFWEAGASIIVSTASGIIQRWHDDWPSDLKSLRERIAKEVRGHSLSADGLRQ